MYGLTRGVTTLIGVAVAGGMIWLASWMGPRDSVSDYWIAMEIRRGRRTRARRLPAARRLDEYSMPRISRPSCCWASSRRWSRAEWVLVAAQPGTNGRGARSATGRTIGISDVVADVTPIVGAVALGLGVVAGFVFDTAGPRVRDEVVDEERGAYGGRDPDRRARRSRRARGRRARGR